MGRLLPWLRICEPLASLPANPDQLFISIAAGIPLDAIDGWLVDEVDDSVDFGEGLALRNHGDFFINLVALARYSDQLARIFFQVWLLEKMESTLL